MTDDSQLRWIGPDKGAIHLATGAVVNAVWDLWAKSEGKPVWRLVADMTPEQFVDCIDFRYLTDCITPDDALALLTRAREQLAQHGSVAELVTAGHAARVSYDNVSRPDIEGTVISAEGWREELAAAGRSGGVIRSVLPSRDSRG